MNNRPIYILLTNTRSLFSTAIGLYTKQAFNHVSIAIHDDFEQIYSFGRKNPSNPVFDTCWLKKAQKPFDQKGIWAFHLVQKCTMFLFFCRFTNFLDRFCREDLKIGTKREGFM